MKTLRSRLLTTIAAALAVSAVVLSTVVASAAPATVRQQHTSDTTTPIQHLVVIFQENVSFDHYFGTYPNAANTAGEPAFTARDDSPAVNGLNDALLNNNPNSANPKRLDRTQAQTCDQDHAYADEQKAVDAGRMDKFVESVSGGSCADKSIVMDYYDGNTVTAMWNYAQHYAMSDNSFGTSYGPSTPGALNLISGQTQGVTPANASVGTYVQVSNGTVINDLDPTLDDCSKGTTASLSGKNVGDLLNAQNQTWGWFEGGFTPSATTAGKAACATTHQNIGGSTVTDYIPHHQPFQYYQSTSNPHHLPATSPAMIGKTDQANHQYDISDFWTSVNGGNMPAVSFLKAPAYQDGHAGYSDPLDEQHFLVDTINKLQKTPEWGSTAIVISYDDSDGWYDHVMAPLVLTSSDPNDALNGAGVCGTPKNANFNGRCGYGPRLPLMVISPFAKDNYVDSSLTDQSSITRFIEDNWNLGRVGNNSTDAFAGSLNSMFHFKYNNHNDTLILDPTTGEPVNQ